MKDTYQRVREMSNNDLETVWEALGDQYWTEDDYNGDVTMTEWAELIYSEMCKRNLSRKE